MAVWGVNLIYPIVAVLVLVSVIASGVLLVHDPERHIEIFQPMNRTEPADWVLRGYQFLGIGLVLFGSLALLFMAAMTLTA